MIRRDFMKSAVALGTLSGGAVSLSAATGGLPKKKGKAKRIAVLFLLSCTQQHF